MNNSDASTTEDSSDCGDETSTYVGANDQDTHIPEPPNSQEELDYLVSLVSSSENEDK